MSRAITFARFGGPEVLELVDLPDPELAVGELRVRVAAAGVEPFDCKVRSGAFDWVSVDVPQQLGNQLAGVVDEVGDGVAGVSPGDEVFGYTTLNAYAELAVVPAGQVVRKPAALSWELAAVLPGSGQAAHTALQALRIAEGDTLLIHAAAGGVGTFAVQLARERGARVIGTASERNHDYLRSLGAEPVAYGDGLVERVRAIGEVDAALDAVGTDEAIEASLALVSDRERAVTLAAARPQGVTFVQAERSPDTLRLLAGLAERGRLEVPIQSIHPLADAAAAHREVEGGHVRGKVVLAP